MLKYDSLVTQKFSPVDIIYQGYVDDRRNTDNAWMETTVTHKELEFESTQDLTLKANGRLSMKSS